MTKLLSIIIPAYNMERYLRTCLDSLIIADSSLFSTLEIIIINDGSTDATSSIAHEYAKRYPDVFRVIDKSNGHYGSCINRGLAEATGTYIKILDADDSFDTEGLKRLLLHLNELVNSQPPVDLVWTDVRTTDENRNETGITHFSLPPTDTLTLDDLTNMPQDRCMHAATYRRAIFEGLNYHQSEGIAYTDAEWMFLPMTAVHSATYLKTIVYNYMLGRADQSMNASVIGKQLAMLRQVFLSRMEVYCAHRETWSPESLRYAQSELSRAGTCLYRTHLSASIFGNLKALRNIDQHIAADIPELIPRIGETDVLFAGKQYSIPYGVIISRFPPSRIFFSLALRIKNAFL